MHYCPLCSHPGYVVRSIKATFLRRRLEEYYRASLPLDIAVPDYLLRRCPNCALEYADPPLPGGLNFYRWLGQYPGYYARDRWEWHVVLASLKNLGATKLEVLELGFGPRYFLNLAASLSFLNITRLHVYPPFYKTVLRRLGDSGRRFDAIVAFHFLEHVPDPRALINDLYELLNSHGIVYLSMPYSPTSVEYSYFDPSNYPPHHLTRWNQKSLLSLSQAVQTPVSFSMPKARHFLIRTATVVNLLAQGHSFTPRTIRETLINCGTRPLITLREIFRQLRRERVNGSPAADVVLLELRPAT